MRLLLFVLLLVHTVTAQEWFNWSTNVRYRIVVQRESLVLLFNPVAERGVALGDVVFSKDFTGVSLVPGGVADYSGTYPGGVCQDSMQYNANIEPYAFEFDGSGDFIDFGDIADVGTNDFIVFAWVKNIDVASARGILGKFTSGAPNFYVRSNGPGPGQDGVYFYIYDGTNTYYAYAAYSKPGWHMLTFVVDRSRSTITAYDNLNEISLTHSGDLTLIGSVGNNASLRIGSIGTAGQYAYGYIGITGLYLYDGLNGRLSSIPDDYFETVVKYNYENTRVFYEK